MFRPSPAWAPKVTNLSHSPGHANAVMIDTLRACPKLDDVGADVHVEPPSGGPSDIDIGDWDELFHAVTSRLRLTVGEPLDAAPETQAHDAAGGVQVIVLECVAALDQLHTALTHERGRREQLEREIFNAQAALARALANSSACMPHIGVLVS